MARLLRRARKRPVDEQHDDELHFDAAAARRLQRHREDHQLDRDIADQLAAELPAQRPPP